MRNTLPSLRSDSTFVLEGNLAGRLERCGVGNSHVHRVVQLRSCAVAMLDRDSGLRSTNGHDQRAYDRAKHEWARSASVRSLHYDRMTLLCAHDCTQYKCMTARTTCVSLALASSWHLAARHNRRMYTLVQQSSLNGGCIIITICTRQQRTPDCEDFYN